MVGGSLETRKTRNAMGRSLEKKQMRGVVHERQEKRQLAGTSNRDKRKTNARGVFTRNKTKNKWWERLLETREKTARHDLSLLSSLDPPPFRQYRYICG